MADRYRAARVGDFVQDEPRLENIFLEDHALRSFLQRLLPQETRDAVWEDLTRFGSRCANEIYIKGAECERQPPSLERYNGWGDRVDEVKTCAEWRDMKSVAAEEGLINIGYARQYGEHSRVVQVAKLILFGASSGLYSCPLAMTDGAAKVLEPLAHGGGELSAETREEIATAFRRLTSPDPKFFATSGQWMTERRGGSDVANGTDTHAVIDCTGAFTHTHRLHGFKWFTSATDADMAVTLARPAALDSSDVLSGTAGLAMFFLWTRAPDGRLNGLSVEKLKKKLGTRQLPTGEMILDGAAAIQLSPTGKGIQSIMELANITRLHNSCMATSSMRRVLQLCRDYMHRREVLGAPLSENPLHLHTLAKLEVEARAATAITLEMAVLLGRTEAPVSSDDSSHAGSLLRIITPLAKLLLGKQAVLVASEGLEAFGGAGYLEDTGLPALLRDAQVLPIWEGTTNVNALDVFRSVLRSGGEALRILSAEVRAKFSVTVAEPRRSTIVASMREDIILALGACEAFAEHHLGGLAAPEAAQLLAREFAMLLARVFCAALLAEHAAWPGASDGDVVSAQRWVQTLDQGGLADALWRATPRTTAPIPAKSASFDLSPGPILAPSTAAATVAASQELEQIRKGDRLIVMEGWVARSRM